MHNMRKNLKNRACLNFGFIRFENAKMTRYFNLVEFFCGVCILLGYDYKTNLSIQDISVPLKWDELNN